MTNYLVVATKSWNRRLFREVISNYDGAWHFIAEPAELTVERLRALAPRYVFFLHWSWKVPAEIVSEFECVCFHMTDLPYGRGGSPLQNLIARGHRSTKMTALRMVEEFDAGPIYLKADLSLEGGAEEILIRAAQLSAGMIGRIIDEQPVPVPQEGEATVFKRRKPEESRLPQLGSLSELHDFIRMLDAEGYPPAFMEANGLHFEFTRATRYEECVAATVRITQRVDE